MFMKLFIALLVILVAWQVIDPDLRLSSKDVTVRKALPMDVSYESIEAYSYLNSIRRKMNMLTFSNNENLKDAAKAHAYYLVANNESTHEEIAGHKHYVAQKPFERAYKKGYLSGIVSENLSTNVHSAHQAVDGLFSAIYHRFGFLSTTVNELGVGVYQDEFNSDKSAFVFLMGNSDLNRLCHGTSYAGTDSYWKSCKDVSHHIKDKDYKEAINYGKQNNPSIIVYPFNDEREIPPAFYSETPDPLPNYDVSGFPVSIEFNDFYYKDISVLSFNLYDYKGNIVDVSLMDKESDPHQRFTKNQFAIFPLKRLAYNSKYKAEVIYRVDDEIKKYTWSFYTKRIQEEFYRVTKLYDELSIVPKKSYVIYFAPVDAHDILHDIQFPAEVDVQFLDNNTIKLTLMSDKIEEFTLDTGSKKLHISVQH
ncbi:MAG TPA: CAP domain-containing protein [Epsilonproteobacteria bacterium]|nr:CAP domain-containing protein [Campylobacterota bacterium]